MSNTDEMNIIDQWNAAAELLRRLSKDSRLTGLASGCAERAASELEKVSQEGIAVKTREIIYR